MFAPRVGFRVGPFYLSAPLTSRPTAPQRRTPSQRPTTRPQRPARPIYAGPYSAPLVAPRQGTPRGVQTPPVPVWVSQRPTVQPDPFAGYNRPSTHRASMRAVRRATQQPTTYRAGMSPTGRAAVALALVVVGGFLATMLLGMVAYAMGIVPATPSSDTHTATPTHTAAAQHTAHAHTAAARPARR